MKKDLQKLHEEFMTEMRYASKRSPSTLRAYHDTFCLLIKLMPGLTPADLTPGTISQFFKILETRKRQCGRQLKTGVKNSTILTYYSKLGPFFSWLERRRIIDRNPLNDMKRPIVNYETRKYLRGEQIQKILSAINYGIKWNNNFIKKRNELIIFLCFSLGLRKSEMLNLTLNDINIDENSAVLTVRSETSKSKRQRQVFINRELRMRIMDYIAEKNKQNKKTHYLICSELEDKRLSESGLKHVIDRIKKGSGVNFSLHPLRHTFSVNYLLQGNDMAKLQQVLGHKDIRMTAAYLRCLPSSEMKKSMDGITPTNLF